MPRLWTLYEEAAQQNKLWTPAMVPEANRVAWFDASAAEFSTYASGTYSQITDRWRGTADMVQGTTSLAPAISNIRGRRAANFDKTNGVMLEYFAATAAMANTFIICVACAVNAVGINARPITFIRAAGGNDYDNTASMALMSRNASNTIQTYYNGAQRCTTTIVDGDLMVFTVECDGTTVRHYLNGVAGGSGSVPSINLGNGQFGVGCYSSAPSTTNYQGLWGEMVAVKNVSGAVWRHKIEGAAAWKWNLQHKLKAHPHLYAPPLLHGG